MYLSEKKLGEILQEIYPDEIVINNKKIPGYKNLCRPDYRLDKNKLIFEFDGPTHYTNSKRILKDKENDLFYQSIGYRVIRIPYFVQIDSLFFENILGITKESTYNFPHGFISEEIVLPADYCYAGILKFLNDLEKYSYIKDDIIESLISKAKDIPLSIVLPEILNSLIEGNK